MEYLEESNRLMASTLEKWRSQFGTSKLDIAKWDIKYYTKLNSIKFEVTICDLKINKDLVNQTRKNGKTKHSDNDPGWGDHG